MNWTDIASLDAPDDEIRDQALDALENKQLSFSGYCKILSFIGRDEK